MSNKIVEYTILDEHFAENLTASVNRYISIGWQPLGRPIFIGTLDDGYFHQAMVKYEEKS